MIHRKKVGTSADMTHLHKWLNETGGVFPLGGKYMYWDKFTMGYEAQASDTRKDVKLNGT